MTTVCITMAMHCIQITIPLPPYTQRVRANLGELTAGRPRLARLTVSVGRFEQLLQLVVLTLGDPRALLGCTCIYLDIFTVSGQIFLIPTLLPLFLLLLLLLMIWQSPGLPG